MACRGIFDRVRKGVLGSSEASGKKEELAPDCLATPAVSVHESSVLGFRVLV